MSELSWTEKLAKKNRRDEEAHALQYDAYLTRADLNRVAEMAHHVNETRRMLEEMRELPPTFLQIVPPEDEDEDENEDD